MTNDALKLKTYCVQLTALLARIPSHPAEEELEELANELGEETELTPLDPTTILDINEEFQRILQTAEVLPTDEFKYVRRAARVCKRIIRVFNKSGTEKILTGDALKRQWAKRNAMSSGENEPAKYDEDGELYNGVYSETYRATHIHKGKEVDVMKSRDIMYVEGKKANGWIDDTYYVGGKKYNGNTNADGGVYVRDGKRYTGERLTYNKIIFYKDGREVGSEPREDV